jgi:serine/threonine protein kinase
VCMLFASACASTPDVSVSMKPENTLVSDTGAILLADFGLAIDCGRERPSTRLGTLDYMAPEGPFIVQHHFLWTCCSASGLTSVLMCRFVRSPSLPRQGRQVASRATAVRRQG